MLHVIPLSLLAVKGKSNQSRYLLLNSVFPHGTLALRFVCALDSLNSPGSVNGAGLPHNIVSANQHAHAGSNGSEKVVHTGTFEHAGLIMGL